MDMGDPVPSSWRMLPMGLFHYINEIIPIFTQLQVWISPPPQPGDTTVASVPHPSGAVSTLSVIYTAILGVRILNVMSVVSNFQGGEFFHTFSHFADTLTIHSRDTLQRHLRIHGQVPSQTRRMLPRASHACINCMRSKQRCSGLHPCDRCNRKDWPCRFPKDSREVGLHFTEATERRTSNETDHELERNDGSEPPQASELSSISVPYPDSRRLESANFTSERADFTLPGQTEQNAIYSDATAIFESFLLWPLDDVSGHSNMALTNPSISQTPSGIARTMDQSINMPFGADTAMELANFPQQTPDYAGKTSGLFCTTQSEIFAAENALTEEDQDILISEDYGHVPKPSILMYEMICDFYKEVSQSSPEAPILSLYSLDILHVCTQLYFEHFHRKFPILHQGTFEARSSSWLLYLAVAAVGSQYSRLSFRTKISSDLIKAIRLSLLRKVCSTSIPALLSSSNRSNN